MKFAAWNCQHGNCIISELAFDFSGGKTINNVKTQRYEDGFSKKRQMHDLPLKINKCWAPSNLRTPLDSIDDDDDRLNCVIGLRFCEWGFSV